MVDDEFEEDYKKGLSKAQFLCSKQEKCISEVKKKLYDWRINPTVHDNIIDSLIEEDFINEERFTKFYVNDKFLFNRWGKVKISYNLRGKYINEELIQLHLDNIDNQKYSDTAKDLLLLKLRITNEVDEFKLKSKIFRHLQSKGFEYDLIIKLYDNVIADL